MAHPDPYIPGITGPFNIIAIIIIFYVTCGWHITAETGGVIRIAKTIAVIIPVIGNWCMNGFVVIITIGIIGNITCGLVACGVLQGMIGIAKTILVKITVIRNWRRYSGLAASDSFVVIITVCVVGHIACRLAAR